MNNEEKFDYMGFYKKFYEAWEKTMSEGIDMWSKSPLLSSRDTGDKATSIDPVTYYKRFYEVWEKTVSEALEIWLKSPLFAATMGKTIEKSSEVKKYLDEVMEKSLKNMHLPTNSDIDRVLASINNIEAKINDLWDKIDELKSSVKSSPKKSVIP
jgi:poly(hydroxyalkanoate) synthase III subunit E